MTIGWPIMIFGSDMHGALRMNPNDFSESWLNQANVQFV